MPGDRYWGCGHGPPLAKSRGRRTAGTPVDMVVLHYTGMQSAEAALQRLCDPQAEVSAHYLVHEDGQILQCVPEARRAWHAGRSFWQGETDINSRSIGIEIVNPGHEFGYRPFAAAQISAVSELTLDVCHRHEIQPWRVLAHSDVAPERKQDPGELFPWAQLAEEGVGVFAGPFEIGSGLFMQLGDRGQRGRGRAVDAGALWLSHRGFWQLRRTDQTCGSGISTPLQTTEGRRYR